MAEAFRVDNRFCTRGSNVAKRPESNWRSKKRKKKKCHDVQTNQRALEIHVSNLIMLTVTISGEM